MRKLASATIRSGLLVAALALFAAHGSAEPIAWHGFVEGGYGLRATDADGAPADQDFTLNETRVQLTMNAHAAGGEGFIRADWLHDQVDRNGSEILLREGFLRFRALRDRVDVKAGRQVLTWGTGDLLFVNDLFPKDWVSFFVGREDQYLKGPSDAVRLGIFGLPVDVDFVWTPTFSPDILPSGRRLAFFTPAGVTAPPQAPADRFEDGEFHIRLSRYLGAHALALYGYRGFTKTPTAIDAAGTPIYPQLQVAGASLRGAALGGVAWIEAGYYDSMDDRDGENPRIANSTARYLAGLEKQIVEDLSMSGQYYGEWMLDHDAYAASFPDPTSAADEFRHLLTMRIEKMLRYQTIRLSGFVFYSPTDEDWHIRPFASYKVNDHVEVAVGANLFGGGEAWTQFGQFDANDNVYFRARYAF